MGVLILFVPYLKNHNCWETPLFWACEPNTMYSLHKGFSNYPNPKPKITHFEYDFNPFKTPYESQFPKWEFNLGLLRIPPLDFTHFSLNINMFHFLWFIELSFCLVPFVLPNLCCEPNGYNCENHNWEATIFRTIGKSSRGDLKTS